jgi:hypothetical protein
MRSRWLWLVLTLPVRVVWGLVAWCLLLLTADDRDYREDARWAE